MLRDGVQEEHLLAVRAGELPRLPARVLVQRQRSREALEPASRLGLVPAGPREREAPDELGHGVVPARRRKEAAPALRALGVSAELVLAAAADGVVGFAHQHDAVAGHVHADGALHDAPNVLHDEGGNLHRVLLHDGVRVGGGLRGRNHGLRVRHVEVRVNLRGREHDLQLGVGRPNFSQQRRKDAAKSLNSHALSDKTESHSIK